MKSLLKDKTGQIMIGLILGIILGLLIKLIPEGSFRDTFIVGGIIEFLGTGFINLIKMTVVPLVFISLVCGMSTFGDAKKLGRVGSKVISFYMITTGIAVTIALGLGLLLKPGNWIRFIKYYARRIYYTRITIAYSGIFRYDSNKSYKSYGRRKHASGNSFCGYNRICLKSYR